MKAKRIISRLGIYILILILSIIIIFFAINILFQKQINKNLAVYTNIEKNLINRFFVWIKNFFTNWGKIYNYEINLNNKTIFFLYFSQFKWTILLTSLIFICGLIIGNILGIYSGYNFNKSLDIISNIIIAFLTSLPIIIIAIFALLLSHKFKYPSQFINEFPLSFESLLVPILISSFGTISLYFSRSKKITKEVAISEYYLFAKSLGFSKKQLFQRVLLKKLIINEFQTLVPYYIFLFSLSLIIERIFSIPGQSIFLTYSFKYAEIDLILFFFTFNLIFLLFTKFIIANILDKLNPLQKRYYINDLIFVNRKLRLSHE